MGRSCSNLLFLLICVFSLSCCMIDALRINLQEKQKSVAKLLRIMDQSKQKLSDSSSKDAALGTLMKLSAYPEAKCLDGSPGAFYMYPGTKTNEKNLIFFMEGGGVCTHPNDCYSRSKTTLGSSSSYPAFLPASGLHALNSRDCKVNPLFCEYSVAYVKYCDGMLYSSTQEAPIPTNQTQLYLRGDYIKKAALDLLKEVMQIYLTETVIISGCSAGAYATFLHADDITAFWRSEIPSIQRVAAIPFSGFFIMVNNVLGQPVIQEMLKAMIQFGNTTPAMNPRCLASRAVQNQWECNLAPVAYNYSLVPTFPVNSKSDAWQIACEVLAIGNAGGKGERCLDVPGYEVGICPALKPDPFAQCTHQQMKPILHFQRQFLDQVDSVNGFLRPENGGFIHSCFMHCAGVMNTWWEKLTINGVSMRDAIATWWLAASTPILSSQPKREIFFLDKVDGNSHLSNSSKYLWLDCNRTLTDKDYNCNPECPKLLSMRSENEQGEEEGGRNNQNNKWGGFFVET